MNFVLALLAYLAFGLLIGFGLVLAAKGSGLVLVSVGLIAFLAAFIKAGCLSSHD